MLDHSTTSPRRVVCRFIFMNATTIIATIVHEVAKVPKPTSGFWLGHDFTGKDIFSNEEKFSRIEQTIPLLPDFITVEIIEFA